MKQSSQICRNIYKAIFLVSLLCTALSCTRYYRVKTDSYADGDLLPSGFEKGASFAIEYLGDREGFFSKEIAKKMEKVPDIS